MGLSTEAQQRPSFPFPLLCTLDPTQPSNLPRDMISRHPHLERITTIAQILGAEHRTLLTDQQGRAESVAAHIVGADGEIRDLEVLDAMDVESLVKDTVLDNIVAFAWCHAASAQGVPGGLAVALHPLLDVRDVLCEKLVEGEQRECRRE